MLPKVKKHLKWIIPVAVALALAMVALTQTPQVVSSYVNPEVIVKGQDREVTVVAIIKKGWLLPTPIRAVMVEQGENFYTLNGYNIFAGKTASLGWLKKLGKDNSSGNLVYEGKFVINREQSETVQIQFRDVIGRKLSIPSRETYFSPYGAFVPTTRLAITTRPATLPPDFGLEGEKTLEGKDLDQDGLRDDIQREIFFAFPFSQRVRTALGVRYKAKQAQILDPTNKSLVNNNTLISWKSGSCAHLQPGMSTPTGNKVLDVLEMLDKALINTGQRAEADVLAYKTMSIAGYEGPQTADEACDFDWRSLPD